MSEQSTGGKSREQIYTEIIRSHSGGLRAIIDEVVSLRRMQLEGMERYLDASAIVAASELTSERIKRLERIIGDALPLYEWNEIVWMDVRDYPLYAETIAAATKAVAEERQ